MIHLSDRQTQIEIAQFWLFLLGLFALFLSVFVSPNATRIFLLLGNPVLLVLCHSVLLELGIPRG